MVAVERLDHARVAEPLRPRRPRHPRCRRPRARHRQPGRVEQPVGEALVRRDVDADRRRLRGHRRPDALLVDAVAELDERVAVEADERDVAADRLVDERLGRRPERLPLGEPDEPLELGREVEEDLRVVGRDEVVDQRDRHPAGLEPDRLLAVLEDAVVLAGRARPPRVLPWRTSVPARFWNSSATCSAMWPAQVPSRSRVMKPPRRPSEQAWSSSVGSSATSASVKFGQHVGGVLLEDAEVDQQPDDRLARPVVRAAQDARLEDAQGRLGAGRGRRSSRGGRAATSPLPCRPVAFAFRVRGAGAACATWPPPRCGPRVYRLAGGWMRMNGRLPPASLERRRTMSDAMTIKSASGRQVDPFGPTDQEIKFCRAPDGVRLAYAIHGSGPPVVVASCWLSHLQYDWQSPVWRHFLDQLGSTRDDRPLRRTGFGLSDWAVDDFSLEARLGVPRGDHRGAPSGAFALLGMSGGSAVALAYAIAHPERVSRLILYGTVCGEPLAFSPDELGRRGDIPEHDPGRLGEGGPRLPARVHDDLHPRRDRGADALVRRPPAHVDISCQRGGQSRRPAAVDIAATCPRITAPTIVLQSIGDRADVVRQRRQRVLAHPQRTPRPSPESQPHPPRRRAGVVRVHRRGGCVPRARPPGLSPDARPVARRPKLSRAASCDVLRLAADGLTNAEIAAAMTLSASDGRAPPVQRLRQARA